MGRWRQAVTELEAAEELTDSVEQHPVLADAHRALGHADAVERLWDELRRGGVGVEVLTEGRIVTAGARADGATSRGAIALLEGGPVEVRRPQEHHLRLWYALAALYERAGDLPRARALLAPAGGRRARLRRRRQPPGRPGLAAAGEDHQAHGDHDHPGADEPEAEDREDQQLGSSEAHARDGSSCAGRGPGKLSPPPVG